MLHIAVCEDNSSHQDEICKKICNILFDKEEIELSRYISGSRLLERVLGSHRGAVPDLVFMDIRMPELDGIATVRLMRKNKIKSDIIFLTEHPEYVFEGYEYHVYDYLLKPVSIKRLEKTLNRYLEERLDEEESCLNISVRGIHYHIWLNHVDYFESRGRKIMIHEDNNKEPIEFYLKMDELNEILKERGFIRCHQSYLVNRRKIESIAAGTLILDGLQKLPVSRRYMGDLKSIQDIK